MRIPALALFSALFLLSSCESLRRPGPVAGTAAPHVLPEKIPSSLPAAQLTPRLLYDILLAEIAGQRGHAQLAAQLYLEAARTTRDPGIAERATRISLFARDRGKALAAANLWVETDPGNAGARETLVRLLLDQNRYQAAEQHLDQLLNTAQGEPVQRFMVVATLLGQASDPKAALGVMERLVRRHGSSPEALLALSSLALRADDLAQARDSVDRALAARPGWVQAMVLRARILSSQGDAAGAARYLGDMVARYPDDRDLRLSYAKLLIEENRLAQALSQFQELAKGARGDDDILFTLGLLSIELGRHDQAREYLLKLADTGGRVSEARYFLGQMAESENHLEEADRWYAGVRAGQHYLDARIRRALLVARRGDLSGAREQLHAIPAAGRQAEVRVYMAEGELLREANQLPEAMDVYNGALDKFPGDTDLLYARALLAERMDDLPRAEEDLRRILAQDADNAEALNALGYTLADRTGRYQEALGYIIRALALRPNDPFILDSMGWVQYRLKHYDEALKFLHRAFDLQQDPEIAAHLGEVLWASGDRHGARRVWDRALQAAPNDPSLREVIRRHSPAGS